MHIRTTDARLDSVAADLNPTAREAAHIIAPCTTEQYVAAYLHALAITLGESSAAQCAPGEEWAPVTWLEGDREAIYEGAKLLEVSLDRDDWSRLFDAYCAA